jgi:hypothetical protein
MFPQRDWKISLKLKENQQQQDLKYARVEA